MNKLLLILQCLCLLICVDGCRPVGPDYQKAELNTPAQWSEEIKGGLTVGGNDPDVLLEWWKKLDDPILNDLIARAVEGNRDLQAALERVNQARFLRGQEESALFPTANINSSAAWTRNSENNGGSSSDNYSAGFDAGWELDIFGGTRRAIEAAKANEHGVQADLDDVLVSLVSEVALNYVEYRMYQTQINAVNNSLKLQAETSQLTQWQSMAGLDDQLAVQQSLYNLESSRSQLPALDSSKKQTANRIAVLLGLVPGSLNAELEEYKPIPSLPSELAIVLPADVIRQRPDIKSAEYELIAQTAKVGVATAELYPKLVLNGSIAISGGSLHRLTADMSDQQNWTFQGGPQLSWNLFDAGAVKQNIKVQSSLQKQALISYESAVNNALEEVNNAIISYVNEQKRNVSLRKALASAQKASELAENEYEAGLTDFSDILESQRTLLSYDNQVAESDGAMASNLIQLYKAMGGGWPDMSESEN